MRTRKRTDDQGFTLVEVMVTIAVISAVLLGLIFVQTGALRTVTLAKQRQQATGLANRTMETLRALPHAELLKGMSSTYLASNPDPNISGTQFRPSFDSTIDEPILASAADPLSPLRPHVQSGVLTTVGNLQYTIRTYVTKAGADVNRDGVMLTVAVTWSSFVSNGQKVAVLRSRAFSPAGCTTSTVRAFSGPCQTFLYGQAGSRDATLQVQGVGEAPILVGDDVTSGSVVLAGASTVGQAEQIITGSANARSSGTTMKTVSSESTSGLVPAVSTASTDPATGPTTTGAASASQTGTGQSFSSSAGTLVLRQGTSDSARAVSVPSASASPACVSPAGASQTNGQLCSSAGAVQADQAAVILDLANVAGRDLPATALASVVSTSTNAYVGRFTASGGTYCAGAAAAGCAAGETRRSVGASVLGALPVPASGDTAPAGFTGQLARATAFSDSAKAESGTGAGAPSAQRSGLTLEYWNGSGYQPLSVGSAAIPTTSVTYRASGNPTVTITASGTVSLTAPASFPGGTTPCQAEACTWTSDSGSVVADISYRIENSVGGLMAEFTLHVDLGAALAKTSYRAAP